MNKFFDAIVKFFRIEDLRNRAGFAPIALAAYRLESFIPTPEIDVVRWKEVLIP